MKEGVQRKKEKETKPLAFKQSKILLAFFTPLWKSYQAQQISAGSSTLEKSQTPNKLCVTRLIKIKSLRPLHQTQIFFKHFGDRIRGFNRDCNPKFHKYNYYFVHVFLSHLSQEIRVYKFGTPSGTISTSHLFFQFQNQPTRQTRWPLRRFKPFRWRKRKA